MSVELLFEKSFTEDEQEILDCFVEFHQALIEDDTDRLGDILSDDFEVFRMGAKSFSRDEFVLMLADGILDFSGCEIMSPEILFGDDSASLISKVRLAGRVNGRELRWISHTVAGFEKADGKWRLTKWDG